MLVRTLMIIIGSISTTIMMFVALIWGSTFLENIDLLDSIAEHAERTAKKVSEKMKGADNEID